MIGAGATEAVIRVDGVDMVDAADGVRDGQTGGAGSVRATVAARAPPALPSPTAVSARFLFARRGGWYRLGAVQIRVYFFSRGRDLAGCAEAVESMPPGSCVKELLEKLFRRFPKLAELGKSTRVAVGLDYQNGDYLLQEGDEVSILPPMQGG
ncbi:MAG: MoaD/ThiS family protein [Verrucomicrobiota bacterium]